MNGKREIKIMQGGVQGCALAQSFYTMGTKPLIQELEDEAVVQGWYSDDGAASGKVKDLRKWYQILVEKGPA